MKKGFSEIHGAVIMFIASVVIASVLLGVYGESSKQVNDDTRSKLDIMRERAREQLDITGISKTSTDIVTFFINNFGKFDTKVPFAIYNNNGTDLTDRFKYYNIGDTLTTWGDCSATSCEDALYTQTLQSKDQLIIKSIDAYSSPTGLILVTHSGKALEFETPAGP